MKTIWSVLLDNELKWWKSLTIKQKIYAGYFLFSFTLLLGTAEGNPLWVILLIALNFGNSVRLVKRVPMDKLKKSIKIENCRVMEYFKNELCVTYEELTSGDDPVIRYQTLRKNITRGNIRTAQRGGGEGSYALIIYSSLREKYKGPFRGEIRRSGADIKTTAYERQGKDRRQGTCIL